MSFINEKRKKIKHVLGKEYMFWVLFFDFMK